MFSRVRSTWFLLMVCLAVGASAQTLPYDVEIGYRWLDLDGNRGMYRTQINERQGLLLRSLTLSSRGHSSMLDHFRLDVSDAGPGPASSLRLEFGRSDLYRVTVRHRRTETFSELGTFANPLLSSGSLVGQHTYDRTRQLFDADVELLKWSGFKPFVGTTWNNFEGPGTTTYRAGQDEFLLDQDLDETDREIRIGTAFELGRFTGSITQGWRQLRGDETLTLAAGGEGGNLPTPVLGRQQTLTGLTRTDRTEVDTPFTNLYLVSQIASRLRLVADYSRFSGQTDARSSEAYAGSLTSFPIGRFFSGARESIASKADATRWRGGVKAEAEVSSKVDFLASWRRQHETLEGSALIDTLYLQSVTFGGTDPRDLRVVLEAENGMKRNEDVLSAGFNARAFGPFSFRIGYNQSRQDVVVSPDLAEIVVGSTAGQEGRFLRKVTGFDAAASYALSDLTLSANWKNDSADDPILRTDFIDRNRIRFRALWNGGRWLRAGLTGEETKQTNDRTGIDYSARVRQYGADIEVSPVETLSFRASASRFRAESDVLFRRPENLVEERSLHLERGKSLEGGLAVNMTRFSLDGSVSRFDNEGTLPFKIDRSRARLSIPIRSRAGIAFEWARDEYSEEVFTAAAYEATRYGIYLRFRQ